MKTIKVHATVEIPRVPNFIILTDGQKLPLDAFTKEGLEEIADNWKENLIARAEEIRLSRKESGND